jgi:hypothetical protein
MDLSDPDERNACAELLGTIFAGRRVVHGPRVLAAVPNEVQMTASHGAVASLVLATIRGAGEIPDEADAHVVWLPHREFASVTEELRQEDARVRRLPDDVAAEVDAFDPDGEALWMGTPFVTDDEPIRGRRVLNGRSAAWLALEDKVAAEDVWERAAIPHAPSQVVALAPSDPGGLDAASAALDRGAGVVWAGDNRDGFNGGGNFVRWVTDADERRTAHAFFATRCDRVRVMPFLDGVPCSIHGFVLDAGTAAFRPVEIAMLRRNDVHEFVYGGLSTYWDPPAADREAMRDVVRRVGEHLRERVGYRGFFGIDGVLTADGFLPTELNTRHSAGVVTQFGSLEPRGLAALMQIRVTSYPDFPLDVDEVESLVPAFDAHRAGRVTGLWEGALDTALLAGGEERITLAYDGSRFVPGDRGDEFAVALNATGLFGYIRTCTALGPGERLAPLNKALMEFLDQRYGTRFGDLAIAPDLRH